MAQTQINILQVMREGRSAAHQLKSLMDNGCLTKPDADRLVSKVILAFDAQMGAEQAPRPTGPRLAAVDGEVL